MFELELWPLLLLLLFVLRDGSVFSLTIWVKCLFNYSFSYSKLSLNCLSCSSCRIITGLSLCSPFDSYFSSDITCDRNVEFYNFIRFKSYYIEFIVFLLLFDEFEPDRWLGDCLFIFFWLLLFNGGFPLLRGEKLNWLELVSLTRNWCWFCLL